MKNNCDNCKYKECLAKLADIHIDCKDCPVVRCIMGVADINVGKSDEIERVLQNLQQPKTNFEVMKNDTIRTH